MDLTAVTRGTGEGTGVPHGDELVRFVNATMGVGEGSLEGARAELVTTMGEPSMVDAAGVIAGFTMMNRIADCTGLPLDAPIEMASRSLRAQIGTDGFASAANTAKGGWLSEIGAWIASRLLPLMLRLKEWRARR